MNKMFEGENALLNLLLQAREDGDAVSLLLRRRVRVEAADEAEAADAAATGARDECEGTSTALLVPPPASKRARKAKMNVE